MKRLIEFDLMQWKLNENRKPLLVNGIRQVGKTFIIKEFGNTQFEDMIYINFDLEPMLCDVFKRTKDPKKILQDLSIYSEKRIDSQKTLIFFDEIQSCNEALNSLKYFDEAVESYYIIGAGSYLGITLAKGESFPVGKVELIELLPMTFCEFLLAQKQDALVDYIETIAVDQHLSVPIFEKVKDFYREYYIVGGMPEAVKTWVQTKDVEALEKVQTNILNAYYRDFSKYPPSQIIPRILGVWNAIVNQLSKENRKFQYSEIDKGARAREYESALDWLLAGGYIHKVKMINKLELPLLGYASDTHFKIYMPDTGLLRKKAEYPASALSVVSDHSNITFKGALAENMVFQELRHAYSGSVFYWANTRQEIDFIIQYDRYIIPIEVKYGENIKSSSLSKLLDTFPDMIGVRYSMKNLSYDGRILNIPIPMVSETMRLLKQIMR